jgi:hypothetical protein
LGNGSRHYGLMPRQQLKEALSALHAELEAGHEIGEEDREALLQATREIQEALAEGEPPSEPAEGPLSGRVSTMIEDFETSHPRFAEILRSVSEALANLGI